ncbi:hypothetical protein BO224_05400 [Erysipelotrichaceae bacterium NYU-BL-E8]|uniref:Recombinase family protein n=3 Tax=cellular organisms TaxID=131567 RepID=A0A1U7NHX9_9FIRM|nr:hypothetical protein BO224_05400 [Erysipelotrichaceae bacterium NYU-BL-E8]OLU41647.1 hypothetical protein BO222_02795 [Ileibacterium valens]OLU42851.1 hypothetical protein BM735_01280 [Erysipelotrichaceae bacterium NYU-BL-F16]
MNEVKTAVIYARYSSSNQREESIESQLRVCHRFAADHDLEVIREYTDSAISGRTDQRPAFQHMISDSSKGEFNTVLIYAHDRFSRDKYDTAVYKSKLKKNGVRIISATLPLDDSPESSLMESIMEGFAQYYSENLSRSAKRGLEENALHAKSNGATPLGYKVEAGRFVLEPVGAEAVRIIFEMYADGYGKVEICDFLNDRGFKTRRGGEFKRNGLHGILRNERYTGVYIYGDHRHEDALPSIISKELFEIVQKRIEANRYTRGRKKAMEEYLLSGKLFCGECGATMIGEQGTSSTGQRYHYYKCSKRKNRPGSCSKETERKTDLEDTVVAYICREVLTDDMIEQIAEKEYALLEEEASNKSLLVSLEAEHEEVTKKIENILAAIEEGIFTPKTKERLIDLEDQQSILADKIVRERLKKPAFTKDHIVFWLEKFRAGDINDFDYKKAVINSLVNSVYLFDEEKGNDAKMIIALNIENVPAKKLTRSDVLKMVRPMRLERTRAKLTTPSK